MGNVIMKAQQITYGASNVEKALDDLKAPELIELNKRMDAIDAWKANVHEETYTGSELTIENALALPARSLITEIEPIQDLHGQSAPYVGGAGKNKLPMTVASIKAANTSGTWNGNVYSINGGTFTIITDADGNVTGINANGTFTSTSNLIFINSSDITTEFAKSVLGQTIVLNGCPSRTGNPYTQMFNTWGTTSAIYDNGTDIAQLSIPSTVSGFRCEIQMYAGTVSNVLFKPMIRLSTESDSTFAPYSNICPISGRSSVVLTRSDGDEISEDFTIQLGQTVYGADINWDTGEGTIPIVTDDVVLESIYVRSGNANCDFAICTVSSAWDNNTLRGAFGSDKTRYVYVTETFDNITKIGVTIPYSTNQKQFAVSVPKGYTIAQAQSLFGTIQLCYPLATPITLQLTPEQLQMLKGYNRVTIESGSIELKALVLGGDN